MSGLTATSLFVACCVEAPTYTKSAHKKATDPLLRHAATVNRRKVKIHIFPTIRATAMQRRDPK
jgi:hypothetical protein